MTEPSTFRPGTLLAERYRLEEILANGELVALFRATELGSQHAVAVKLVTSDPDGPGEAFGDHLCHVLRAGQPKDLRTSGTITDFGRTLAGCVYLVHPNLDPPLEQLDDAFNAALRERIRRASGEGDPFAPLSYWLGSGKFDVSLGVDAETAQFDVEHPDHWDPRLDRKDGEALAELVRALDASRPSPSGPAAEESPSNGRPSASGEEFDGGETAILSTSSPPEPEANAQPETAETPTPDADSEVSRPSPGNEAREAAPFADEKTAPAASLNSSPDPGPTEPSIDLATIPHPDDRSDSEAGSRDQQPPAESGEIDETSILDSSEVPEPSRKKVDREELQQVSEDRKVAEQTDQSAVETADISPDRYRTGRWQDVLEETFDEFRSGESADGDDDEEGETLETESLMPYVLVFAAGIGILLLVALTTLGVVVLLG